MQKEIEEMPRLLTVPEAAEYLGIPLGGLRKRIFLRQIPIIKLGRSVYIDRKKLERFLNEKNIESEI